MTTCPHCSKPLFSDSMSKLRVRYNDLTNQLAAWPEGRVVRLAAWLEKHGIEPTPENVRPYLGRSPLDG